MKTFSSIIAVFLSFLCLAHGDDWQSCSGLTSDMITLTNGDLATACCPSSCGECGSESCGRIGEDENCCVQSIFEQERFCGNDTPPCIISMLGQVPPMPPPADDSQSCSGLTSDMIKLKNGDLADACCPSSCGECGSSGCGRIGQDGNCCVQSIFEQGRFCGEDTPPCIISMLGSVPPMPPRGN